jgi:tRNA pseudouridine32 synthase/23S rRNA pseudouridine746 synthase/23S rRNA pseudouridine1911/1915/1917 synthase
MTPFTPPDIPRKHRPKGLVILYEDRDVIVVNKEPGVLTTATLHKEDFTAENVLTDYVRKGCSRSNKQAYVVHRLDRGTSGVLLFAKSEAAQDSIKKHWKENEKYYLVAVHGHLKEKRGLFSSYLAEDENLFVRSVSPQFGRLSRTLYAVIRESPTMSLVKIRILTGRRNQIRVQFADSGHPVVGDSRYGHNETFRERLCLHAKALAFNHPHSGERLFFDTPIPDVFTRLFRDFTEAEWTATQLPDAPANAADDEDDAPAPRPTGRSAAAERPFPPRPPRDAAPRRPAPPHPFKKPRRF